MTSLTIELPEALAQRVQKTGVLQSPELLQVIEQLTASAEQRPSPKSMRLIDRLAFHMAWPTSTSSSPAIVTWPAR